MNAALKGLRQLLITMLVLLCAAWASGLGAQWLLRYRAQKLLADIRSLNVNHSSWSDAQAIMKTWGKWSAPTGSCTPESCNYRINLIQTLPPFLVGHPDPAANNTLPRLMDRIGLRNAAARAGFTVEHGIVTSRWFGLQVTLPIQDWTLPSDFVPYLSVSSGETAKFRGLLGGNQKVHPHHATQISGRDMAVTFSPEEDPAVKETLLNFRFDCLTQFHPCETQTEILPEATNLTLEEERSPSTR
jgi:hypothetical protein